MESKKKVTNDSRKTSMVNSKKKSIVEEVDDLDMSLECMNEVDAKELEKEIKYFQASDAPDAPVLDVENQFVEAADEETFVVKCDPDGEAADDATDEDTKGVAEDETTDVKNFLDEIPLEMDSRSGDDAENDNDDVTDIDDTMYDNNASNDEIETNPTRPSTSSGKKSKIVEIVPEGKFKKIKSEQNNLPSKALKAFII